MGYTHYFKQNKPVSDQQWDAFEKDAKVVLDHVQNRLGIVLKSDDSNGILLNNNRVNLNGDEARGLDHETFYLAKDYRDFNFCKTAQKPYDLAVCSLLLLANEHMHGHHEIGSDGNFEDWKEAMELNAELFGRAYLLPRGVDSSDEVAEFEEDLSSRFSEVKASEPDTKKDITKKKSSRYNL